MSLWRLNGHEFACKGTGFEARSDPRWVMATASKQVDRLLHEAQKDETLSLPNCSRERHHPRRVRRVQQERSEGVSMARPQGRPWGDLSRASGQVPAVEEPWRMLLESSRYRRCDMFWGVTRLAYRRKGATLLAVWHCLAVGNTASSSGESGSRKS